MDIPTNNSSSNRYLDEIAASSYSTSTERFNTDFADNNNEEIDHIDKAQHLFIGFPKNPPTLEEALTSMDYGDISKELTEMFTKKAEEKISKVSVPGLTVEDIAAIYCYMYEWNVEKYGEIDGPYQLLNKSLSVDRSNTTLKKTRQFLFLLLRALRKFPRYVPEDRVLYRVLRTHVQTEVDPEFPRTAPYAVGNEKTWWAFTSTTEDFEIAKSFVWDMSGTLFILGGNSWGYEISAFSDYPDEKEILMEPERRLKITAMSREGDIIIVNANMLSTSLILNDITKPPKSHKAKGDEKKKKSKRRKEVVEDFKAINITHNSVELAWPTVYVKDTEVTYQVSMKKAGFFNRNGEIKFDSKDTNFVVEDLENWTEYEFRVRSRYNDMWGKWSDKLIAKTSMLYSWKECCDADTKKKGYSVDEKNPRIATTLDDYWKSTIAGRTSLPPNKITPWNIRVLKSRGNNSFGIYVGVAPSDIGQNDDNHMKCGWYFDCYSSTLYSGPPHNYKGKEYGPRKEETGEYVREGDSVGVIVDTNIGTISFVLNGVNLDVAYEGIPLDKPLVPCAILKWKGDSVELYFDNDNIANEEVIRDLSIFYPRDYEKPTMKDALLDAGLNEEQADKVVDASYAKAHKMSEEGKLPKGVTEDDAAAIAMYTFDFDSEDLYEKNPYRIISRGLNIKSSKYLRRANGLIYLVLSALRKLPRTRGRTLYRGVKIEVNTNEYKDGETIFTWSGLPSTSPNIGITKKFLGRDSDTGEATGTMFVIEDAWGYDIAPYSLNLGDFEIILEPERQFKVSSVIGLDLIVITIQMINTPLMLPEVFGEGNV